MEGKKATMAKGTFAATCLRATSAIASALVGMAVVATPALAATVTGADSYVSANQEKMTVLTVDGSAGETVYVKVSRDGQTVADRLEYTLADAQGTVALDFSGTDPFDPSSTYVVSAYGSRDESSALYEGTIRPVYATLAGGGTQLIGVSTKGESDASRSFVAPATLTAGEERVFSLSQPEVGEDGTYSYAAQNASDSVTGTLSYVTDDGTVVAQTTVDGITPTQSQTVAVEAVVQDEVGAFYRSVRFSDEVTLSYLSSSATVRVKPAEAAGGYYVAQVKLVSTDGTTLATDSLSVTKKYAYTAPSVISVAATDEQGRLVYESYKLVTSADEGQSVVFEPGDAYSQSGEAATFTYRKIDTEQQTEPLTWVVVVENIAETATSRRVVEQTSYQVEPGTTASYVVKDSYTSADGTELFALGSCKGATYTYEYGSGADMVQHVYVAPEGYADTLEPYELTVNYVDVANNEVVRTQTINVTETNADTLVDSPATFVEGGVTYVRLAGQEEPLVHNYFNANRTYTVYYRDVNDTDNADVVIRRLRTIYLPGTTTVIDGGTTTTDNGTTTTDGGTTTTDGGTTVSGADATVNNAGVGGTDDTGATVVGTPGGENVAIDNGDGSASVVTPDGEDAETMRIEDQATPLAGPSASNSALKTRAVVAALGAAAAVLAVLFVIFKRRKAQDDNADKDGEVM